jgi:GBP family porin
MRWAGRALILAAVFLASPVAAQSSLTVYGRIDQNLTLQKPGSQASANGVASDNGKSVVKLSDGSGYYGRSSLFGLRGVEDLGQGRSASFRLESGIRGDTGGAGGKTQTSTASLFNRMAYVGLGSASLGEMRLGRVETLSRELTRLVNSAGVENELYIADSVDPYRGADGSGYQIRPFFQIFGVRADNAVSYRSPVIDGVQVIAIATLSEKAAAANPLNGQSGNVAGYRGVSATWIRVPFQAALSYEELSGGGIDGGSYNRAVTLGGNWDVGPAMLFAAYQHTSDLAQGLEESAETVTTPGAASGIANDAVNFGVMVPAGRFTFKVQYTESTLRHIEKEGVVDVNISADGQLSQHEFRGAVSYAFSARTSIYALATRRGGDESQTFSRKAEYSLGLAHNF